MEMNTIEYEYIVYKTTNLINNKIYIGVHRTIKNVKDKYIGQGITGKVKKGKGFAAAVAKYGYENFKRETLFTYPDTEEGKLQAYKKEAELVNWDFVRNPNTYNLKLGGKVTSSVLQKQNDKLIPKIRPVYQFDLQGNYITYYKSIKEASEATLIDKTLISNTCTGNQSQAGGYFWSYKKRFTYNPPKNNKTAVACYQDDGTFIRSFDSLKDAAKEFKVHYSSITSCIQGKSKHSAKVRWRYFYGNTSKISSL